MILRCLYFCVGLTLPTISLILKHLTLTQHEKQNNHVSKQFAFLNRL